MSFAFFSELKRVFTFWFIGCIFKIKLNEKLSQILKYTEQYNNFESKKKIERMIRNKMLIILKYIKKIIKVITILLTWDQWGEGDC